MVKLTVDAATGALLAGLKHSVELFTPSGERLGWFHPFEFYVPPFTDDELLEAENEPGGRTLAEIMADLERRQ